MVSALSNVGNTKPAVWRRDSVYGTVLLELLTALPKEISTGRRTKDIMMEASSDTAKRCVSFDIECYLAVQYQTKASA